MNVKIYFNHIFQLYFMQWIPFKIRILKNSQISYCRYTPFKTNVSRFGNNIFMMFFYSCQNNQVSKKHYLPSFCDGCVMYIM
jgi:hypothetical protein